MRMGNSRAWVLVVLCVILGGDSVWCKKSRVWRDDDDGAYRDVVIAIHPSFMPTNCTKFFQNLKEALGSFSSQLWRATHGHVHLGDVGVVVPTALSRACSISPTRKATWEKWTTADLLVTHGESTPEWAWGPEGSMGVSVSQPEGCGRPGQYISLDPDVLVDLDSKEMDTLGRSLLGSWARYRWGVFEERGYESHPKYPAVHSIDDAPVPTTCTTAPTKGRWEPKIGSSECNATEELKDCHWIPDTSSHVNTSLMYRVNLPEMWGFCDSSNHDPDAPTPHNLLCGADSVWDVMNKHPDFSKKVNHRKEKAQTTVIEGLNTTKVPPTNASYVNISNEDVSATSVEYVDIESNSSASTVNETVELQIINATETLYLEDVRTHLFVNGSSVIEGNSSSSTEDEHVAQFFQKPRRKRGTSGTSDGSTSSPLRPSLVTAHIATTPSPPLNHDFKQDFINPELEDILSYPLFEGRFGDGPHDLYFTKNHTTPTVPPPALPDLIFLSPASNAVVLALDLSEHAVNQVNMDDLRGGILRWLWGLGKEVKVGVVAAYNNASYPLTLGPILPAPTTAAELEDKLTLLPSADEVEDGVYGGKYCLECVLTEAAKMLEGGGVEAGAGVLLLAACSPTVPPQAVNIAEESNLFIHTVALCPNSNPVFDQLAQSGGSWVLPGLSVKPTDPEKENKNEHKAALSLTAATNTAMSVPGSPTLFRVASSVIQVTRRKVEREGPYSTVTGQLSLPGSGQQLIVITTQYQAKVIKVVDRSGNEIDVIRDTNQRFWAIINKQVGSLVYTLKFLSSSIEFPFTVVVDAYERKRNKAAVEIDLYTNNENHAPLEPGSQPLIVWASVIRDGQPVVGAKVMLTVSHLSQDGSTDMTLQLLDNGNAEPDVRNHDGIYTRYVTWLPGEGRYALSASATDNQGAASVLTPRRRDGRVVPVSAGQFEVTSAVVSVTVLRVTSEDLTPPSRITDLTVTFIHDTTVNLTWSAPGGDLDQGSAWLYELKMYTERSALSEEKFNTSTISVYCITDDLRAPTKTPSVYGTPQYCLTELPFTNLRWYFAIRAVDSANNTGKISNVVTAFVPDPPTNPPPTSTVSEPPANIQTVMMSTITSANPRNSQTMGNETNIDQSKSAAHDWRVWVAVGVGVGGIILAVIVVIICICCCKKNRQNDEKDPDRPIYKIYVNNAYIQEEDGEIKVVSNGKLMDDKEPSQVQEWVNSLSKFGSNEFGGDNGDTNAATTEAPLVECRPRASMKYSSPVRFGVLTNGSIMRETCASSSSTSSSKPSDDPANEDFKYRDLLETTSNSTTDGGASASSTEVPPPPPPPIIDNSTSITLKPNVSSLPPPPPPSQFHHQPLGIPGPTVISIHPGHNTTTANGYSSDEEGGFRPRTVPGPGPRRYLPTHFSSFRYLPPPPEYRSAAGVATATGSIDYPHHTISRATATLPHGTVRSVKKRRHISFV
ncbi:calcium-activated chloride channel regulator 1-like [Palaemon carinicauda]|uniref:calcium-activated chloride channel regulator 1-like n=1 Tax=Palaemon carinicauda TaxID=392227 RepID=UPI0035B5E420